MAVMYFISRLTSYKRCTKWWHTWKSLSFVKRWFFTNTVTNT